MVRDRTHSPCQQTHEMIARMKDDCHRISVQELENQRRFESILAKHSNSNFTSPKQHTSYEPITKRVEGSPLRSKV
jgi:hypothetical protein